MTTGTIEPISENEPEGLPVHDRRSVFSLPGVLLAAGALICATLTILVLLGYTPIAPTQNVVIASAVLNSLFVLGLAYQVVREVARLVRARSHGRAAARLHVRIVTLFSVIAIAPAIIIAIFASITLSAGLDRWFSIRTQSIVQSSMNVAQAYMMENASYLQGQTISMAGDLERNRALFYLDRTGFTELLTRQARGRGLLGAFLVREDGSNIVAADVQTEKPLPEIPKTALQSSAAGQPTLIPPGVTNLVGAIIKLETIPSAFLYTIRAVDPKVMAAMREIEDNTVEYKKMEAGRGSLQLAFAVLYLGFALIVLLAAIWAAIAVADRIVRPIRLLIAAADSVASGKLDVVVPVRAVDGDVGSLSRTFNKMISEIRSQQNEILVAKDEVDDRRRFIEAVLSGVTAAVIGVEADGRISIVNSSAELFLGQPAEKLVGARLSEIAGELATVLEEAASRSRHNFRKQINMMRGGVERTLSVQVTREEAHGGAESHVLTLDDITDLVIAQRSTAWADVARRIAHEIKNPLTPIQLSAERLKRRFGKMVPDDDRKIFDQCTDTIVRQVGDIGRMVDEFSSFARMPKPVKESADLRDILRDAIFLREMGTAHVDFVKELGEEPLVGSFDSRMLGQAFGNLIKNAVEAIEAVPADERPDEGRVLVRSTFDALRDRFVIDVIDNGRGLPSENRHRILEPYITMREKGTGLGLAIVKKIIEEHGGILELHDAPADFDRGRGAMIRVLLPLSASDASAQEHDKEAAYGL